ncbi:MAG TPA: hypothetical protein DEA96_11545 [Leptospiraceae bacterium]|nr:hypothetical protein [Spirochaetaceae bacterium]HBS05594.1 hypothetical protein [Leptospiraceae bacterium]
MQRLYAARAAAHCQGPAIGDALMAIVLGDHPEVQQAALESLEGHLNPGHLSALIEYGIRIQPADSAYLEPDRESMSDLPPGHWQKKELVFRYIHQVLEQDWTESRDSGKESSVRSESLQEKLGLFLKQGLHESRSGRLVKFSESRNIACYNLDSLALLGENPDYLLRFIEEETHNPGILACGLHALARIETKPGTSLHRRAEALAIQGLRSDTPARDAARQWYSGIPKLGSLSRLMRSFRKILPFNEPEIRKLARALPGMQGLINQRAPMYADPFASGPVIRILSHGEAVDVLRRSTGYDPSSPGDGYSYLVKTEDGITGWVSSEHLVTETKKN